MQTDSSAYLFLFRETAPERYDAMSTEQRREALRKWNAWMDELAAQGKLQSGNPLHPEARVVSAGRGRAVDGPFTEAKELIGGYFLLHADSLEEATALAKGCPSLEHGMVVEVRPVAGGCHLARSLGLEGMREPAAV